MKKGLNRREFLHGIGASLVGLSLVRLQLKGIGEAIAAEGYQSYPYPDLGGYISHQMDLG